MKPNFLLTPLTTGQILDRAFRLYRRNFFNFIGILAAVQIISASISALPAISPNLALVSGLGSIVVSILSVYVSAALSLAIAHAYLGEPIGIGEAYRQTTPHIASLFLLLVLSVAAGIAFFIWLIIPLVGWFTAPGMLFMWSIIAGIASPIIVLEQVDGVKAVRRGWELVRGRFWAVAGFAAVIGLLTFVISVGPSLVALLFINTTFGVTSAVGTLINTAITLFIGLFVTPLMLTSYVLFYLDLRVRQEGLDIMLMGQMEEEDEYAAEKSPLNILRNVPQAPAGSLITGEEFKNFFLLSLIVIAIFVVFAIVFGASAAALINPSQFGGF